MRELFKNFSLEADIDSASELETNLRITGLYEDGVGYVVNQFDYTDDVYPKLEAAGYVIKESPISGACPTLTKPGTKMSLYMHPENYSGHACIADINQVKDILMLCPLVRKVEILYEKKVMDLSDLDYKHLLIQNSKRIIKEIKAFLDEGGVVHSSEIGFDFARNARIPRVGDKSGLFIHDTDIQAVTDIFLTAVVMGEFDEYKVVTNKMGAVSIDGKEKKVVKAADEAKDVKIPFEEFVPASWKVNKEESAFVPGFGHISMDVYISRDQSGLKGTLQRYDCVLSSDVSKPLVFSCVKDVTQEAPNLIYCFGELMAKARADMVTGIEKEDLQRFFSAVTLDELVNETTEDVFQKFLLDYTVGEEEIER